MASDRSIVSRRAFMVAAKESYSSTSSSLESFVPQALGARELIQVKCLPWIICILDDLTTTVRISTNCCY